MATQPDFWGDIGADPVRSPVAVLREQAALLGSKTKNLVEARVETSTFRDTFRHAFLLVVPTLDYQYQLFSVSHGLEMYPLEASLPYRQVSDEEAILKMFRDAGRSDHYARARVGARRRGRRGDH